MKRLFVLFFLSVGLILQGQTFRYEITHKVVGDSLVPCSGMIEFKIGRGRDYFGFGKGNIVVDYYLYKLKGKTVSTLPRYGVEFFDISVINKNDMRIRIITFEKLWTIFVNDVEQITFQTTGNLIVE